MVSARNDKHLVIYTLPGQAVPGDSADSLLRGSNTSFWAYLTTSIMVTGINLIRLKKGRGEWI